MSKRRKSNHSRVVNVVLAAALAFTAVVSTAQLASVSDDLSASVNGRYVAIDPASCVTPQIYDQPTDSCITPSGGGGGSGGGTISCNSLNGQQVSPDACNTADTAKNACLATTPPGTWNGTGSGSCTAGGSGSGGTCAAGSPAGNCITQTTCQSANFYWYNNVCNTTNTVSGGASSYTTQATCTQNSFFWYNNVCNNDAGGAGSGGGTCVSGGTASACTTQAACQSANFYWYSNVCNATAAVSGGGTCVSGGAASACITQPTCQSANFYWYNNVCNTTAGVSGGQACSGGTPITCSDGSCAGTQLECSNRVGCSDGQVKDSTGQCVSADTQRDTNVDANRTYDPAYYGRNRDSAGCIAAGYRWDSGRNDCFPAGDLGSVLNTATWYCGSIGKTFQQGQGGPECNCGDIGGTWSNGTCVSASGETVDTTKTFVFDPLAGGVPQCGQGQFYDFREQKCKTPFNKDNFFNEDLYDTFKTDDFECPEWDIMCQQHKEQGKLGSEDFEWKDAGCLSSSQTKTAKAQIQDQLKDLEQQFNSISFSSAGDTYAVATTKTQLDTVSNLDLNDPCQAGQAMEFFKEFDPSSLDMARILADFRRELERIQSEIDWERNKITDTTALGYLDSAEDTVTELYANPPINMDAPWELFESLVPECMRMGGGIMGPGGGGGGMSGGPGGSFGPPQFGPMCTIEELITDGTPRGLLDAARMVDDQGRRDQFGGDMCKNAARHIFMFESKVIPELSGTAKTKAEELVAKGKALAVVCQNTAEGGRFALMQRFEAIGREAEALMAEAGVDFDEFGFEGEEQFDLGGADQLVGSDLMNMIKQLIADAVKTATDSILTQLVSRGFDSRALEEITIAMNNFSGAIAEKVTEGLGGVLETFSYLPEESTGVASEITEETGEILQTLDTIRQVDPEHEDDTEDFIEELVDIGPLPLDVLDEVKEEIEDAAVIAENGGDPTPKLEAAQEVLDDLDKEELTDMRIEEGIWFFDDVHYGEMWEGEADQYLVRAKTELNLSGTENEEGKYDFEADKTLNVAEGLTMMAKTMGFEGETTASAEVQALVGSDASWAAPYVQELVDEVGIEEVKEVFTESGGAGGAMDRAAFAGMAKELADNAGVDVSADPDSEIGHYDDFDEMDTQQQSDFAFAHKIGMITGANGGQEANFEGKANRLEAAKMLTEFQSVVQEAEVVGTESTSEIGASFERLFGEDLVNLGTESLESGDPTGGITGGGEDESVVDPSF